MSTATATRRSSKKKRAPEVSSHAAKSVTSMELELKSLQPHPYNRDLDADSEDIRTLGESLDKQGQLEAIRVRAIGKGKYQVLSGHRRRLAMLANGWQSARCELVVGIDDAAALAEVAAANAQRLDLNVFQQAELLVQLMKPESKGGSGMNHAEAGSVFGIAESTCRQTVRMLQLSDKMRRLILDGTIPRKAAQELLPFLAVESIAKDIENELTGPYPAEPIADLLESQTSRAIPYFVESAVANALRPMDADVPRSNPWPVSDYPCLFEPTDDELKKLGVVELPWAPQPPPANRKQVKRETRWFATNAKLWDKLQAPKIKEAEANKKAGKTKSKPKQLTPSQKSAEEKRKAKEADERLAKFTNSIRDRLIRCFLATRVDTLDSLLVYSTLPWLFATLDGGHCDLDGYCTAAFKELGIDPPAASKSKKSRDTGYHVRSQVLPLIFSAADGALFVAQSEHVLAKLWQLLLWPVSGLKVRRKAGGSHYGMFELTPLGELPGDDLAKLNSDDLDLLLDQCGYAMVDVWNATSLEGTDESALLAAWLARFTKVQLQSLFKECHPKHSVQSKTSRDLVQEFLHVHSAADPRKPVGKLPKLMKC